ncbi:ROK family transcriptional regulator [Streptomyces sp. NPDC052396]|uniref:ROK family transcriptional regulator n=1 Tax=Streptomyces sp. NPDC052396 TaxID=3365689 RepID=UPI0037CE263E
MKRNRAGGDEGHERHGANLAALRDHNSEVLLGLLRDAAGNGASRAELARRTGLTPQAVSKITARLREAGLVTEAGRRASTGGKPATALRLVPEGAHAVGVRLDRAALTVILVDLAGTVVAERSVPLSFGAGAGTVLDVVAAEVAALPVTGRTVLGVGVAAPGPLDHRAGVLGQVTGFPQWDGFPLREALAERLSLPVVVDKDTNAAALGLLRGPHAHRADSFAYLHLGSGLGAGLVFDGAVHRGARTGAGEFGHQVLSLDGPECGCGRRGCLEALCLAAPGPAEAARLLGVGAANLVRLLDIDRVVLGGERVLADPRPYLAEVRAAVGEPVPVELTPSGPRTVAEGAAELVLAPVFGRG